MKFKLHTFFAFLATLSCTSIFANQYVDHYNPETSKFHVVTCASHPIPQLQQLLTSAHYNGIKVEVLGLGQPYQGNARKLRGYLQYLQTAPEKDIVMFVDAYDVLILADEKTILDRFHQLKVPFLISTDKYCYPLKELADQFPTTSSLFRYLNSGGFIGYAGYLKELFKDLPPFKDMQSDQAILTRHFLTHRDSYHLDYQNDIFISLNGIDPKLLKLDHERKKIYSLITESYPPIVHCDGFMTKKLYQSFFDALFV